MPKVATRTLAVGDGTKGWKRWQPEPVLPKRHRWNMSRCQVAMMAPWQVRGTMARPLTTHPVRLGDTPACRYHFGSIVFGADRYVRFGLCGMADFIGPWVRSTKHTIAKMFVSMRSRNYDFDMDEMVVRKTYAHGAVGIDNPAWVYGLWFSAVHGIPI